MNNSLKKNVNKTSDSIKNHIQQFQEKPKTINSGSPVENNVYNIIKNIKPEKIGKYFFKPKGKQNNLDFFSF